MTKLQHKISQFLATNPTEIEIEEFYLVEVLPYDKRSINEIVGLSMMNEEGVEMEIEEMEIEEMVHDLPLWEQEPRRMIYRFMNGALDIDINTLLATRLISNADGWSDIDTIGDYYEYMKDEATQDLHSGLNASFAIDFVRIVEEGRMYKVYEGYEMANGLLELDEDHPHNYVVTEDELVERFVESTLELQGDTEDPMREWLTSQPEIGDILHGHPSDLPIKRIA